MVGVRVPRSGPIVGRVPPRGACANPPGEGTRPSILVCSVEALRQGLGRAGGGLNRLVRTLAPPLEERHRLVRTLAPPLEERRRLVRTLAPPRGTATGKFQLVGLGVES